jgi:hypothetical protein
MPTSGIMMWGWTATPSLATLTAASRMARACGCLLECAVCVGVCVGVRLFVVWFARQETGIGWGGGVRVCVFALCAWCWALCQLCP